MERELAEEEAEQWHALKTELEIENRKRNRNGNGKRGGNGNGGRSQVSYKLSFSRQLNKA